MAQSSGETLAHRRLKRAALFWAQQEGYTIAGLEVRVPNSSFRADVAAYRPDRKRDPQPGVTAIFECKQARPDFLRDRHDLDENLSRLRLLNERRVKLELQLGIHYPHLRNGDSLFQEYESVDLRMLNHEGYRQLRRDLEAVESRVYGKTKFSRMIRWQCANLNYLVAPRDMLDLEELPAEWGLLCPEEGLVGEAVQDASSFPELIVARKPRFQEVPVERRLELLQCIGTSGTRLFNQREGIEGEAVFSARSGRKFSR